MTPSQCLARARTCYRLWRLHRQDPTGAVGQEQPAGQEKPEEPAVTLRMPSEPSWRESVVIRDGFYRGRRFAADDVSGTWFLEEDELKIQDCEGKHLASFSAEQMAAILAEYESEQAPEQETPQRRAA